MPQLRISAGLVIGVFALAAILLYVLNPSGTASPDPRLRILGFSLFRMPSASMTPTLQPSDLLVVSAYPYRRHKPSVGDLAVFYVGDNGPPYVKRVIARGGERVRIESGVAIVNGVALEETYVSASQRDSPYAQHQAEVSVGDGEIWVLGDNRDNSRDSRLWGPIEEAWLVGKVVAVW